MRRLLPLLLIFALACSEDSNVLDGSAPDATARPDASSVDAQFSDAAAPDAEPADAAVADGGFADSGAADTGTPDSGAADAEPSDASDLDAGTPCDYLDLNVCIVQCAAYQYARQFVDLNGTCPEFYRLNGNDYPDIRTAIATEMCNPNCIYKASTSVSFIDHCNRRNGYIIFRAMDASCGDLYEFSNGLFASREDWEAATPCGP